MEETIEGIIVRRGGKFLSRARRWVRHRNKRHTRGVERAFVHDPVAMLCSELWQEDDGVEVLSAVYDRRTDSTVVAQEVWTPFRQFQALVAIESLD